MNILLDTHAWLWFHLGDSKLTQKAKEHILNPENAKFVSPASFWEISIKISLGKYSLNIPYAQFMAESIKGQGFQIIDVAPAHTDLVTTLLSPSSTGPCTVTRSTDSSSAKRKLSA